MESNKSNENAVMVESPAVVLRTKWMELPNGDMHERSRRGAESSTRKQLSPISLFLNDETCESEQNHWVDVCKAVKLGHEQRALSVPNMRYKNISLLLFSLNGFSSDLSDYEAATPDLDILGSMIKETHIQ
jgi:hypothetical protein